MGVRVSLDNNSISLRRKHWCGDIICVCGIYANYIIEREGSIGVETLCVCVCVACTLNSKRRKHWCGVTVCVWHIR